MCLSAGHRSSVNARGKRLVYTYTLTHSLSPSPSLCFSMRYSIISFSWWSMLLRAMTSSQALSSVPPAPLSVGTSAPHQVSLTFNIAPHHLYLPPHKSPPFSFIQSQRLVQAPSRLSHKSKLTVQQRHHPPLCRPLSLYSH